MRLFFTAGLLLILLFCLGFSGQRRKQPPGGPDSSFCKESRNICQKRCRDINPPQRDRTQNERAAKNRASCMEQCSRSYDACMLQ